MSVFFSLTHLRPPRMLAVLTPPTPSPREPSILAACLDAGASVIHVRKPRLDAAGTRAYLQSLPPRVRRAAVLHAHHGLATEFEVKV